jgi:ribulose 1,5-bisphosphate carboxylase large subunit-like protein
MSNNVFISFEFNRPDRTYDRVVRAIRSISESCAEIHFAHWYVSTTMSPEQVCERLKSVLDETDKLVVVDTTSNKAAWLNLSADAVKRLREQGF